MAPPHPPAEPFFLETAAGARFCLYHPPAGPCRGALLHVHPFAEEMNRARRMAALQARAFAARGIAVLLLDLHGCGDSAGDFGDASWNGWLDDLDAARAWLEQRSGQRAGLWGLRLGGLLALESARRASPARLLLWQPVTAGAAYLNGFLRLRLAADMLQGGEAGGSAALLAQLEAGQGLEIAGYTLAPALAMGFAKLDARELAPPCPVDWFELVAAPGRPLPPAAIKVADAWQAPMLRQQAVCGPQFWATPEVAEAPELITASCAALEEVQHA